MDHITSGSPHDDAHGARVDEETHPLFDDRVLLVLVADHAEDAPVSIGITQTTQQHDKQVHCPSIVHPWLDQDAIASGVDRDEEAVDPHSNGVGAQGVARHHMEVHRGCVRQGFHEREEQRFQ